MRGKDGQRVTWTVVDRHIVISTAKYRSKWWTLTCTCGKGKRRKDGSCKHQRALMEFVRPNLAPYVRFNPNQMGEPQSSGGTT